MRVTKLRQLSCDHRMGVGKTRCSSVIKDEKIGRQKAWHWSWHLRHALLATPPHNNTTEGSFMNPVGVELSELIECTGGRQFPVSHDVVMRYQDTWRTPPTYVKPAWFVERFLAVFTATLDEVLLNY